MAFARWDPLRDLLAIQQRLDRFAPGPAGWVPPVDLYETATDYVIVAELPGLKREDLQIHVQENRVRLTGARRGLPRTCEQHHRVERGHGSFDRTFQLPHSIDPDRIVADLLDGVLTVTCPKVVEAGARRVRIS